MELSREIWPIIGAIEKITFPWYVFSYPDKWLQLFAMRMKVVWNNDQPNMYYAITPLRVRFVNGCRISYILFSSWTQALLMIKGTTSLWCKCDYGNGAKLVVGTESISDDESLVSLGFYPLCQYNILQKCLSGQYR